MISRWKFTSFFFWIVVLWYFVLFFFHTVFFLQLFFSRLWAEKNLFNFLYRKFPLSFKEYLLGERC